MKFHCVFGWFSLLSQQFLNVCSCHLEVCKKHRAHNLTRQSHYSAYFNTLRPRHNGRCYADDTSKRIFFNENVRISIKISLKFVPKGPINNIPALVQIKAWRRSGDKPLSEPIMVSLPTNICVNRPQWVNSTLPFKYTYWRNNHHLKVFLSKIFGYLNTILVQK